MIFAIQYDEESGYCDNIQQAVGAATPTAAGTR